MDPPISVGVGDKLVMSKNWYGLPCSDGSTGIFNGEIGKVIDITHNDEIVLDLEDRVCVIPPTIVVVTENRTAVGYPQESLYLAYAITTHKAQGSEYENVMYVMDRSVTMLINRRNFYTGITRARTKVSVITDSKSLSDAIFIKEPKVFRS